MTGGATVRAGTEATRADFRPSVDRDRSRRAHLTNRRRAHAPRTQAEDSAAFAELYDRHHAAAFRVAHTICRSSDAAEDALQDGFVSAWRGRSTYLPGRGVRGWLLVVVRNRAIDEARRESVRERRRANLAPLASAPSSANVLAETIAAADAERMRRLVGDLPDTQRDVIALAFYGQLTHAEIAAHLELPPGTVKGRMRLGLRRLSEDLAEVA